MGSPMKYPHFNEYVWAPALRAAGVEPGRENGMHALRHWYASVLLDAGESIKAVSEYLGHASAAFTLATYTHLMPSSEQRTRSAVDRALGGPALSDGPTTARENVDGPRLYQRCLTEGLGI
jgi:integrase